ncbi:BETA-D-XYLOSIDASE 7-RELATED [Salix viminalis]|uniref:BETA-D-XYLOSIDASE 7-RELATED n=1 Tax=Salix viminalis TaxID=40686 RepID=A0A9Q0ZIH1_SALVM|nr:BETA-D-XYLOSIDASE 7-RELATED [Salix viminalis]
MKLQNLVIFLITSFHLCVESTDSSHPQDPNSCASASRPPSSCDSSDPSTKTITRYRFSDQGATRHPVFFNRTIQHATSFPQVILTAASFDPHIWYRIGQATGKEARALYNAGQATGLGFWAPNINIFRDPGWGRGQETTGEDPLVVGKYGSSFVKGVQGDSFEGESTLGNHLQASACCKHYTAHDLDNWNGVNRFRFNAIVTLQDMADIHSDKSGASTGTSRLIVMPSMSYMLSEKYSKTPEDAVADALKSGMDVECSTSARSKDFLLRYNDIGPGQVCSQEHQALALEAALDGIVLLKNSDRLLPLSKSRTSSLAVIGPNAHNSTNLLGNYFGPACKNVTILEALRTMSVLPRMTKVAIMFRALQLTRRNH